MNLTAHEFYNQFTLSALDDFLDRHSADEPYFAVLLPASRVNTQTDRKSCFYFALFTYIVLAEQGGSEMEPYLRVPFRSDRHLD